MFGFGVYRNSNMRVWLGPSIRLNVDFLTDMPENVAGLDVGIGGGLALGVNWHTGDTGSVGLTFGYQYLYAPTIFANDSRTDEDLIGDETFGGQQHLISVNLTYLFRSSGDRFFLGRKR
jgi:hypothetical protein